MSLRSEARPLEKLGEYKLDVNGTQYKSLKIFDLCYGNKIVEPRQFYISCKTGLKDRPFFLGILIGLRPIPSPWTIVKLKFINNCETRLLQDFFIWMNYNSLLNTLWFSTYVVSNTATSHISASPHLLLSPLLLFLSVLLVQPSPHQWSPLPYCLARRAKMGKRGQWEERK